MLFGNLSYVWTMEEDEGERNGGTIDPGDVIRFGFGMGFAFNERTSFSLGYDHSIIGETDYELDNSLFDTRFEQVHVGSLTFGLSAADPGYQPEYGGERRSDRQRPQCRDYPAATDQPLVSCLVDSLTTGCWQDQRLNRRLRCSPRCSGTCW